MIRLREAVTDAAETLRRLFRDPPCHSTPTVLQEPVQGSVAVLEAASREPAYRFLPTHQTVKLSLDPSNSSEEMSFSAKLQNEDAWGRWAAGAVVCEMPVFQNGGCSRMEVPALPKSGVPRRIELPPMRVSLRTFREWVHTPLVRESGSAFRAPAARQALEGILGIPIAVTGQDFQSLPRALGMRYTLQLVKDSGENIRNLEILGVYQIPMKGVRSLRHDGKTGRILLELGMDASNASRAPFILARKKDDRTYVSCFLED